MDYTPDPAEGQRAGEDGGSHAPGPGAQAGPACGAQQGVKFGDESRRGFDWVAAYGRAAA